ncbi:MAG: hypothetical protein WCE64_08645 [Bacteroidales bacterium]
MKLKIIIVLLISAILFISFSCSKREKSSDMNIIFLHHSTGAVIWYGTEVSWARKITQKYSGKLANLVGGKKAHLPLLFENYNRDHGKNYLVSEMVFPKAKPYGWNNFPFDYYNLWVNHAGEQAFMTEPTLEILTKKYQVIIFKHCYPVSNIGPDLDSADISSFKKTLSNYKLQYNALKDKLAQYPSTKFILFTGAAQVKKNITEYEAIRAREFFTWVSNIWDQPGDNIYLWDLYSLETDGGLYFKDEYTASPDNSHPGEEFAGRVVKLLFSRIVDVIENNGTQTLPTGEKSKP